ncbi:hypothetical protein GCM10009678_72020 [Actinomadura kijaniata]
MDGTAKKVSSPRHPSGNDMGFRSWTGFEGRRQRRLRAMRALAWLGGGQGHVLRLPEEPAFVTHSLDKTS